jgi:hypothetical protein
MGRTVPISAGQLPDTTRTAAGQVVTVAAAQAVAMPATGVPHAGRTAAAADPRGPCRRRPGRPAGPVATAMPRGHQDLPRSPRPPAAELPGPHLP